jgi:predicted acylesterase/phospholipase RssA
LRHEWQFATDRSTTRSRQIRLTGESPKLDHAAHAPMKISLVLGGGGAKGFVHVGALLELAEAGYEIESIVGTSIGALVAAIFAYNFAAQDAGVDRLERQRNAARSIETVFLDTDFQSFRDINWFSLLRRGLLRGQAIEDWLLTQLLARKSTGGAGGITFEELQFPLTVVVTDALTGDSHELNRDLTPGLRVHNAVRASISIQGIFKDVTIDVNGKPIRAWDGGNSGNCRIDIARRQHPDLPIVAVSLTYRGDVRSTDATILTAWLRPKKLYEQALNVLMRQFEKVVYEGLPPEARGRVAVLRPDLGNADTFSFALDRAERRMLIENGRASVRKEVRWLAG